MHTTEELAEIVIRLSQELLDATRCGDLGRFKELMALRDSTIAEIEACNVVSGDVPQIRYLLESAKGLNDILLRGFEEERQKLVSERASLKHASNMRNAYEQNR